MNLLVKKIGLVLLPALFFACEDPTELGANINPGAGNVSTHYVEIPLSISQVRNDSLVTAVRPPQDRTDPGYPNVYIGKVEDADVGVIKSTLYAGLAVPYVKPTLPANVQLDSIVLQLVWNKNVYGKGVGNTAQQYNVYRLNEPLNFTSKVKINDTTDLISYNYLASDREAYTELIGTTALNLTGREIVLDKDTLRESSTRTIGAKISAPFASEFFGLLKANTGDILSNQQAFDDYFKGIAVVPDEGNTYLTSYNLADANSGLFVYYKQGTESKIIRFPFIRSNAKLIYNSHPAYYGVEIDRSGTPLSNSINALHLQGFEPNDSRVYFQGISGIYPKVDFTAFKNFVEGQKDGVFTLNRATLEFDSLYVGSERQPLPRGAELYFVENNNRRFASNIVSGFERSPSTTGRSYKVGDKTVNYYQSDIIFNLEQYLKSGEERYLQGVLYPSAPFFYEPNKFIIRQDQVKLKIWYTKLSEPNL